MYYNPLTKEEEFHELVKEIESQSAYKRVPSPEKKYMSVAEMGRLLGLKKTDRYWLVHKNFFKTEVILGENACGAGKLREMVCQSDQISQGYRGGAWTGTEAAFLFAKGYCRNSADF